ncbi:MAG: hypothetical protein EOP13_07760, partial [Pseudomonas sp.]
NPRAMIASPNRYGPRANETVEDLARHYGTSVLPAQPRHFTGRCCAACAIGPSSQLFSWSRS